MTDYRPCMHQAVDLHVGRLVSSYSSLLDSCSVNEEGNLSSMGVDNFLLKLHTFAIIHSTRSLLSIAADYEVNQTLYDLPRLHSLLSESSKNLQSRLARLKKDRRPPSTQVFECQGTSAGSWRPDDASAHEKAEIKEESKTKAEKEDQEREVRNKEEEREGDKAVTKPHSSSASSSDLQDLIFSPESRDTSLSLSPFDALLSSVYPPLQTRSSRTRSTKRCLDEEGDQDVADSSPSPRPGREEGEEEEEAGRGDLLKALLSSNSDQQRCLGLLESEGDEETAESPRERHQGETRVPQQRR